MGQSGWNLQFVKNMHTIIRNFFWKARMPMLKRFKIILCTFLMGVILCTAPVQAACSLNPLIQHPVSTEFLLDADCIMDIISTNPEFAVMCRLYNIPKKNKIYTTQALNEFRYHLFERFGYVDIVALSEAIRYKEKNGLIYLYLEPVYLRTIQKSALSQESVQKILKKLKITKKVNQVVACKRIARWMVHNYEYDIRTKFDYDLNRLMKTKKMVCHGYASIFYALVKECGIDVHYVITEDHAFNYVIVKGQKYYYDITYACGDTYIDGDTGESWVRVNKKYVHSKKNLHPKDPVIDEY